MNKLVVDGGYSHVAYVAVSENHGDLCGAQLSLMMAGTQRYFTKCDHGCLPFMP
jgi:hypothetical protein